jgi:mannose-6-phosphate isomerase
MLDEQDIPSMLGVLHKIPVKAGDVVYVKAGLPHAIGEGVFMVELQEPTDFSIILEKSCAGYVFDEKDCWFGLDKNLVLTTIDHRVYSWEDVQRELVIKPKELRREGESTEVELLGYNVTECFAGRRLTVVNTLTDDTHDRFHILIVLNGEGKLFYENGSLSLKRGTELFIPATLGQHRFESTNGTMLTMMKCLPAALPTL